LTANLRQFTDAQWAATAIPLIKAPCDDDNRDGAVERNLCASSVHLSDVTSKQTARLAKTAHHEAGHAVAHIKLDVPFRKVTIEPGEDYLGQVSAYGFGKAFQERMATGYPTARDRDRLEREIICILAGPLAEYRFARRRGHVGATSDHRNIVEILFCLCAQNEMQAFVKWLEVRTENLLHAPGVWPAMKSVAKALLERKTLTQAEVRSIFQDKINSLIREPGETKLPVQS
jgi:ATP-dependent Zn protease